MNTQRPFGAVAIGALLSLVTVSSSYAGSNPPKCDVSIVNCHPTMAILEIRVYNNKNLGLDSHLIPADTSGRSNAGLPTRGTGLTCEADSACYVSITIDQNDGTSAVTNLFKDTRGDLRVPCGKTGFFDKQTGFVTSNNQCHYP